MLHFELTVSAVQQSYPYKRQFYHLLKIITIPFIIQHLSCTLYFFKMMQETQKQKEQSDNVN